MFSASSSTGRSVTRKILIEWLKSILESFLQDDTQPMPKEVMQLAIEMWDIVRNFNANPNGAGDPEAPEAKWYSDFKPEQRKALDEYQSQMDMFVRFSIFL